METRPKNMPRWEWEKKLEADSSLAEKEVEEPKDFMGTSKTQFKKEIGIVITAIVMAGIVAAILFSMSGPSDTICGEGYHWVEDWVGHSGCSPD